VLAKVADKEATGDSIGSAGGEQAMAKPKGAKRLLFHIQHNTTPIVGGKNFAKRLQMSNFPQRQ